MEQCTAIYKEVLEKLNRIQVVGDDFNALVLGKILYSNIKTGLVICKAGILAYFLRKKFVPYSELKELFDEQTLAYTFDALRVMEFLASYQPKLKEIVSLPADNSLRRKNLNNLRKFILTILDDFRSIFIVLGFYLFFLRSFYSLPEQTRKNVLITVEYVLSPVAHRLGFYNIKAEFDDNVLKYSQPEVYSQISNYVEELKQKSTFEDESAFNFRKFRQSIYILLKEKFPYSFILKGRIKSIASIYKKLIRKKTELHKLRDIFAIRIIITDKLDYQEEIEACWQAYDLITQQYELMPNSLKDYLSNPKPNGYQSLHFTVYATGDVPVEVQIRTKRMDEIAERGDAAHWVYKENGEAAVNKDETFAKLRAFVDKTKKLKDSETFSLENLLDEIYIFTPNKDIKNLPKGATILDFAYSIHTELGNHCVGAIVRRFNSPKTENVTYKDLLENGMTVEILTSPQQEPKSEWLNIVRTKEAKKQIKSYLKQKALEFDVETAKEAFIRKLDRLGYKISDPIIPKIVDKLGYQNIYELYKDIAESKIDLSKIRSIIEQIETPTTTTVKPKPVTEQPIQVTEKALVAIIKDKTATVVAVNRAKCCNPKPGDPIFVYISPYIRTVHHSMCPNLQRLRRANPDKVYPAIWLSRKKKLSFAQLAKDNTVFLLIADGQVIEQDIEQLKQNLRKELEKINDLKVKSIYISGGHSNKLRMHVVLQGKLNQKLKREVFQWFKQQKWILEVKEKHFSKSK